MDRRRRRFWTTVSIIILIITAQLIIFQPVRDIARKIVASPVVLVSRVSQKISNGVNLLKSINELSKENSQLKQINTKNLAEIAELKYVKNENEQLREDLKFSQSRVDLELLSTSVIGYSPIGSFQSLTIDRGSDDGVKEGQAVVSSGFLVGKVKNVSSSTSEVWLISNRNLLTPVVLTGSQVTGILKGGIRGLVIDNIPVDTKISKGELVVTSSIENLYPAGIAVGEIEEIISQEEEIFIQVRISSPINIGNIRTLFIVK